MKKLRILFLALCAFFSVLAQSEGDLKSNEIKDIREMSGVILRAGSLQRQQNKKYQMDFKEDVRNIRRHLRMELDQVKKDHDSRSKEVSAQQYSWKAMKVKIRSIFGSSKSKNMTEIESIVRKKLELLDKNEPKFWEVWKERNKKNNNIKSAYEYIQVKLDEVGDSEDRQRGLERLLNKLQLKRKSHSVDREPTFQTITKHRRTGMED